MGEKETEMHFFTETRKSMSKRKKSSISIMWIDLNLIP